VTTLSAQAMTLPLLMFYFFKLSLISLLANILILPIIPFFMTWGLLQMIIAAIIMPLGQIMGWVSWLLVAYWVNISILLHQIPYGFIGLPAFSWFWLILMYSVIFIGLKKI
jgi:competence protein ComEC